MASVSPKTSYDLPEDFVLSDEFADAFHLMENSDDCMFITGKAGSGKSTLLKYFRIKSRKKCVVLAPTGIAAINVDGQTIHSFFSFAHHFLDFKDKSIKRRKKHAEVFEKVEAIVIDEISMVRADLMDAVDHALRLNRGKDRPFGGVQVIFFGDMFQLPPVVREPEVRALLEKRYGSPYFFSAKVFKTVRPKIVELTRIYRQKDQRFIDLLNKIREKKLENVDLEFLNSRVGQAVSDPANYPITLTPVNALADTINEKRLSANTNPEFLYEAEVEGDFDSGAYPAPFQLKLKKGTQVMLTKNDPEKRWVNGSIGEIIDLWESDITVLVNGFTYKVKKAMWEKIEYTYNADEDKMEKVVVGSYEQYPIKPAWAITIHRSQGQTFDNVIIDLGRGAFAHGQVYVALSRCRSFEGVTLKRPVRHSDIIFDETIYKMNTPVAVEDPFRQELDLEEVSS